MITLKIKFDRHSLIINGKREFIRSGAMHYFRLPSVELWRDRLLKLKAAGYNTVDLYFNWGYHSDAEGQYDFDGIKDVEALIALTEEMGFYLIARPGPYINAETNGGGFPNWLLAKKNLPLRNRKDSAFVWSDDYMAYVTEWWEQIIPKINKASNLILLQIENEYSTSGVEPEYIQALYDLTRKLGVTVPLFHNDLFAAGLYSDVVDIYAFDNYSVTQFETPWRTLPGVFSMLDYVEQNLRNFCQTRPMMVAELQAGWFGLWKGHSYTDIMESLGREHIQISTKTVVAQGVTIFNHYKAIGGTNWGHIGSAETYTSYDFNAPISETGVLKESYAEAKLLNLMLAYFNLSATEAIDPPTGWSDQPCFYKLRQAQDGPDSQWLFVRNLETDARLFEFKLDENSVLTGAMNPHEMLILPVAVALSSGDVLDYANTEVIYQNEKVLVLRGDRDVTLSINGRQLSCAQLGIDDFQSFEVDGLKVILLSQCGLDNLWVEADGSLVAGPETVLSGTSIHAYTQSKVQTSVLRYGFELSDEESLAQTKILKISSSGKTSIISVPQQYSASSTFSLPVLRTWQIADMAQEMCDTEGFTAVSEAGADLDANGLYNGTVWYQYQFETSDTYLPLQLTLDAQHIWGVFLNQHFIGQGHQLNLLYGQKAEPAFIPLPPTLLKKNEKNRVLILLHSLGHPKGFHDDGQDTQGIHLFKIDGIDVTSQLQIKPMDFINANPCQQQSPIVKMETTFLLNIPECLSAPLGLDISTLPYEHVQIYLNGVLVGRYWQACQAQGMFYLPEGILNVQGENTLSLVAMSFSPLIDTGTCQQSLSRVMLKSYAQYQCVDI